MLRIAEKDLNGLPVDSLFGCRWHHRPENPSPDFPEILDDPVHFDELEKSELSKKKYAFGRI